MPTHRLGLLREAVELNLFSFPLNQLNLRLAPRSFRSARLLAAGFLPIVDFLESPKSLHIAFSPNSPVLPSYSFVPGFFHSSGGKPTFQSNLMDPDQVGNFLRGEELHAPTW